MRLSRHSKSDKEGQMMMDTIPVLPQYSSSPHTTEVLRVLYSSGRTSNQKGQKITFSLFAIGVLLLVTIVIGTALVPFNHTSTGTVHEAKRKKKRIRRLALLRPFGKQKTTSLSDSFDEWNHFLPCDYNFKHEDYDDEEVIIDIFLSFSQSFSRDPIAKREAEEMLNNFLINRNDMANESWARCFRNFHLIETNIDASNDLYLPIEAQTNGLWVNGPNKQFYSSMKQIMKNQDEQYDAVLLLEHDCIPIKQFWLDTFLTEAETKGSFAILGSKYDGDSWSTFRSSLPLALQHHINGNAMYNLTHPLLRKILVQLKEESQTPYNAVPYDYRISQILVEGMLGVKPDLPQKVVQKWEQETGNKLKDNSKQFHRWWIEYGTQKPIRESTTIANYASTNLLPHHLQKEKASLIHGAKHYLPWDRNKHNITLVVSDWHDELAFNLLYQIDSTNHPFSKLIVLVPDNLPKTSLLHLSKTETKIEASVQKRKNDFFDVCNAQIDTDWFMITNSYHVVAEQVDLLFSKNHKFVVPFTPSEHQNCITFPACREAYEKSKKFDPNNRMIVQDNMLIFNTKERNQFCDEWRNRFGEKRMDIDTLNLSESVGSMGPSATTYISYLSRKGNLHDYYEFTDQTFYGARDCFKRIFTESAEKAANVGETPLSNYILQTKSKVQGQMLHMERVLQNTAPSFSRTLAPSTLAPTRNLEYTLPPVVKPPPKRVDDIPLYLFGLTSSPSSAPTSKSSAIPTRLSMSPSSAPVTVPTLTVEEEDKLDEIKACRVWCYLIGTPWTTPDKKVFPKCMWKFSCSECPECDQS